MYEYVLEAIMLSAGFIVLEKPKPW